MSTEKMKYWKNRFNSPESHVLAARRLPTEESNYFCKKSADHKLERAVSDSRLSGLSRNSQLNDKKRQKSISNVKMYNKLNHQLK